MIAGEGSGRFRLALASINSQRSFSGECSSVCVARRALARVIRARNFERNYHGYKLHHR